MGYVSRASDVVVRLDEGPASGVSGWVTVELISRTGWLVAMVFVVEVKSGDWWAWFRLDGRNDAMMGGYNSRVENRNSFQHS